MSETITMGGILGTNTHLPCESFLPVVNSNVPIDNVILSSGTHLLFVTKFSYYNFFTEFHPQVLPGRS